MTAVRRGGVPAALTAVACLAAGCGLLPADPPPTAATPPPGAPAVALVVGRHAGAPDPALTATTRPVVDDAVTGQGYLAIVAADGTPAIDRSAAFARDCGGELACSAQTGQQRADVDTELAQIAATDPETDLVGALSVAARALPATSTPRTLLVIDPGLSTTGPLRFQDPGVLGADPAEVAGFLAATSALPDLRGISVVFTGLGDTVAPQQSPGGAVRANLRAIWAGVAARAGAASVRIDAAPPTGPARPGLPAVTPVPVPAPPVFDGAQAALPDSTVGFRPDTAELRDPAGARALLTPLAQRVRTGPLVVTLIGTTSSAGRRDELVRLSRQRAEAIKALLVSLGVPAQRIRTRGDGYVADPPDTAGGRLLPGPAAQNRKVLVRLEPPA